MAEAKQPMRRRVQPLIDNLKFNQLEQDKAVGEDEDEDDCDEP